MGTATVNYPCFKIPPSSARFNSAVEQLSRIQSELISDALRRAVDDARATMKHQLSEPLTALLLYMHEIEQVAEINTAGSSLGTLSVIVDRAVCEIERVCNIIEPIGKTVDESADVNAAIARRGGAIDWCPSDSGANAGGIGSLAPAVNTRPLTPREQEVLALITGGCSNKEGGYRLGISTRTFEAHRARLMGKLGARNVADLIRKTSIRINDVNQLNGADVSDALSVER
jgi:DNA-binding CsgD family transcriptional regulator